LERVLDTIDFGGYVRRSLERVRHSSEYAGAQQDGRPSKAEKPLVYPRKEKETILFTGEEPDFVPKSLNRELSYQPEETAGPPQPLVKKTQSFYSELASKSTFKYARAPFNREQLPSADKSQTAPLRKDNEGVAFQHTKPPAKSEDIDIGELAKSLANLF
jgi:hypothetical protein